MEKEEGQQAEERLREKKEALEAGLKELGSVAVAFSGGVDSTFLLKEAKKVLGDKVIAVTARSCSFPKRELEEAKAFCEKEGIRHIVCESEELQIEGFRENPPNRCYLCKKELFQKIGEIARQNNVRYLTEGSNLDDNGDYRPGLQAVKELGVKSPLRDAGMTKADIRALLKEMGLPVWEKPSFACLASRFAYGETITEKKLEMVDRAEQLLIDMGFRQARVRIHGETAEEAAAHGRPARGTVARIEVEPAEFQKLMGEQNRKKIAEYCRECGFDYVALDLEGYSSGSMNRTLAT